MRDQCTTETYINIVVNNVIYFSLSVLTLVTISLPGIDLYRIIFFVCLAMSALLTISN